MKRIIVFISLFAWPVLLPAGTEAQKQGSSGAASFALEQNFPNPFNPETVIRFTVSTPGYATLSVFNLIGQKVATLFDGTASPGSVYTVTFDGRSLPSGFYFCRLQSGGRTETKRMLLMR